MVTRISEGEYNQLMMAGVISPAAPRRRNKTPESAIVSACIKWLWHHGCYVWRNNTGMLRDANDRPIRYGLVGSADIIGMTPAGQFLSVECKSGNNGLSDKQREFGERVTAHSGIYIVARSIDDLEANRGRICQ